MARNRYSKDDDLLKQALANFKDREKNYTREERLRKLQNIYDDTLDYMEVCSQAMIFKGTAAAGTILERARLEMEAWDGIGGSNNVIKMEFDLPAPWDTDDTDTPADA